MVEVEEQTEHSEAQGEHPPASRKKEAWHLRHWLELQVRQCVEMASQVEQRLLELRK